MKIAELIEHRRPNKFMRGGCYAFALWLNSKTKLPLYGLYDDEDNMHHAMVFDVNTDTAYDARGAVKKQDVTMFRGLPCAGTILKPTTRQEVKQYASMQTPVSSREIRQYALNHSDLTNRFDF